MAPQHDLQEDSLSRNRAGRSQWTSTLFLPTKHPWFLPWKNREPHAVSPGVESHVRPITTHCPKPAQPVAKFWLQAGHRSRQVLRQAGKVVKPKWIHKHRQLLGASETHSSSWEMSHVNWGKLQQPSVQALRKRPADLRWLDGASLLPGSAAGEGTERKEAGSAGATALPLHGSLLPAKSDEAHSERPRKLHLIQYISATGNGNSRSYGGWAPGVRSSLKSFLCSGGLCSTRQRSALQLGKSRWSKTLETPCAIGS